MNYAYDFLRRVTKVEHCDGTRFTYSYTGDGQLHEIREYTRDVDTFVLRRSYEYTYDILGRLVNFVERDGTGTIVQHGNHSFDDAGRMTDFRYTIPGVMPAAGVSERNNAFRFDADTGNLDRMYLATGEHWRLNYTYDNLQRLYNRRLTGGILWETGYQYRTQQGTTSTLQVEQLTHQIGNSTLQFEYEYDSIGQITWWRDPVNNLGHFYDYDGQNQLVEERLGEVRNYQHTFRYSYDTFGNIRQRQHWDGPSTSVRPTITTFSYGNATWPDLLTAVNGNPITHDYSGNPTQWHDGRRFTWERGRELVSVHDRIGNLYATFEYDVNGIRTRKTVAPPNLPFAEHTFYTQGGRIVAERREFSDGRVYTLEFFYDEAGRPLQMRFSDGRNVDRIFNYVLNLQGDVIQIRDPHTGAVYAQYLYNAWGELLESSGEDISAGLCMSDVNPIRYRGYYRVWLAIHPTKNKEYSKVLKNL